MRSFCAVNSTMEDSQLGSLMRIEIVRRIYCIAGELDLIEIHPQVIWFTYKGLYTGPGVNWDLLQTIAAVALSLPA